MSIVFLPIIAFTLAVVVGRSGTVLFKERSPNTLKNHSVHDKFHRTLILSGFCLLKIAKISLNSSFFPKPIKR